VFVADGTLFRRIERAGCVSYDRLMGSGLYQALVGEGLLLPHEEVAREEQDGAIVIRPERVPLISYPYEWCFSQLRDAALLTLRLQAAVREPPLGLRVQVHVHQRPSAEPRRPRRQLGRQRQRHAVDEHLLHPPELRIAAAPQQQRRVECGQNWR
jgi:hypothetical protein